MMMQLSDAALATGGIVHGAGVSFDAVTTDSRRVAAGDLFIALRGEKFDGHDFVAPCLGQGAVAAMVDQRSGVSSQLTQASLLEVADTRIALGDLAAYWRTKFPVPLAAITGSNGKTSLARQVIDRKSVV